MSISFAPTKLSFGAGKP